MGKISLYKIDHLSPPPLARGEFALRMINAEVDEDGTYR
jgi:hypothetical protein